MGDERQVDHADGCGLNNADGNTNVLSQEEHIRLTLARTNYSGPRKAAAIGWAVRRAQSTTKFYGVSKHRRGFVANASVLGQGGNTYLGKFPSASEAAIAVNRYLQKFDVNDARLNRDQNGEIL